MTLHKKVLSTILGGAVGDALGVPVEFKKRDSFRITTMTGSVRITSLKERGQMIHL
ncbi:ADP-ribosylglycohydrolase family protein [Priestia aryabhattai]|nr:ADP-ribosylglycohydrolase family protein [Priestia aryabhattai]MDT0145726.1 ADP-ribosylglycohydrolase family protein [Priestia aryabhattai]MDT0151118.1 ADP-ribosylglycohydrolase family protein [Priestia aryabhattai]